MSDFEFGDKLRFRHGADQEPRLFLKRLKPGEPWVLVIAEKIAIAEAYRDDELVLYP